MGKTPQSFPYDPVIINDRAIEVVDNYKYLGTTIDNKLNTHLHAVCKKAHQQMYGNCKLHGFNVDQAFMKMFYSYFI